MPSSKNVHFRNLTAAHVDDPHGGCGAHSGPLTQGSPHVFVQGRPLVREKDLPPCAGRPDHEPAVHCHVGGGGGAATSTIKRGGVQSAPRSKCTAAGHPVDVATGHVFTDVFELAAPALPGFPFARSYTTETAGENGPLGWGWTHSLAQRLEHGAEGMTYQDAEGRRVLFPPLDLGDSIQHLDERITLAQGNEGEYVLERADGLLLFFEDEPGLGIARLQSVFDEGGQSLVLEYEASLLRRVTDSLGNVYRVDSEDGLHWHGLWREADEAGPEQCLARYEYDRTGNLLAAADALGQWRRYGYDHAHRLVQETDRNGFSFFFEYDARGRCVRTRGGDGVYDLSFSYAGDRPLTTQRDAQGRATIYEYSDLGLVTRVTDAAGQPETFTYAGAHQVAHTDALGRTTRFEYDPQGRITERTSPGGAAQQSAYDGGGLASLTDAEGDALTRTVTPEGRLLVTSPSAFAPLLAVHADPDEGCLVVADGAGHESRLYLDGAGRLAAAETPLARTLAAGYDAQGDLEALTDGAGRGVRFGHDALGRLTAVEREGGSGFRFAYDHEGNLTHFIDGNEAVTRFGYAGFNQLHSVTAPDGRAVRFEYDDAGRLHRLTDARRSSWQFDYDAVGRVERLLHPDGGSESFSYDPAGQVRRRTARSGAGFDYEYDADGNLTETRCGDGTALAFRYDKNGRVTAASGPGSEVSFEYDGLGRLTRETQNGQAVAYAYDAAGRLSGLTTPGGEKIAYEYDADGDLVAVTNWNGGRHAFVYDEAGTMQSAHAPNGVSTRFDYSPLGLPLAVHLERDGKAAPLARIGLRYDGNDALVEAADSALGRARFEYDPAGRLVRASGASPEEFEYDGAGNLVRHGRQGYEYDAANRLVGGAGLACRHDGDGNLVQEETPEGVRRFTYDALGLLTRAELPGGVNAEYGYDPFGRRLWKRVQDAGGRCTETRWVWAGDQPLSETVTDDEGDTVEARDFLFLPGSGTPLAQRVDGAVFCCHTDSRGAPTRLTDGQGRVAWAAAYAAYGQAHVRKESVRQPLRLPGQYHDAETGLHQNRWRPYDPSRGRYLSPDPLGLAGGLNLYAYAGQDPIGQADPLGLFPSLAQLIGGHLGPQAARKYLSAKGGVTQAVLDHLGPLRRLLPPASPRPPDPAMSLAHPAQHLPPAPAPTAQAPASKKMAHHAPPHHAPPPAKAAQGCAPPQRTTALHRHRAPVPLPPQPTTPYMVFTAHDTAQGLKTGLLRTFHFLQGMHDQANDMVNPLKIYQGLHEFGQHEAAIYIPDPDGHTEDGDAFARKLGRDTLDSLNPFDKKSAYEAGRSTTNLGSVVVPGAVEIKSLGELRLAARATGVEAAAARAAADAAVGTTGEASARAAAAARAAQARAALRARLPGAGVRRGARQAGEKAQRARAAVAKYRERRAAGVRDAGDPLAPHTPQSLAKGQAAAAGMRGRWHDQAHGRPTGQTALARAGGGGGGETTHPIGRPGVMQMAGEEAGGGAIGRKPPIKPTGEAKGKPSGVPEGIEPEASLEKQHDIRRQNEAADALAYHGYKVEHKSPVVPSDNLNPARDPDYRIEGEIFDGYAPGKETSLDNVRNFVSKKVKKGQTTRVLLNLTDSNLPVDEIKTMFTVRKPVLGQQYGPLNQVIAVRPKPGAIPTLEGSTPIYQPQDMDVFNIFP